MQENITSMKNKSGVRRLKYSEPPVHEDQNKHIYNIDFSEELL